MLRATRLAVVPALALLGLTPGPWASRGHAEEALRVPFQPPPFEMLLVPDEFVVVFRLETAHRLEVRAGPDGRARANLPSVQRTVDRSGALRLERQFPGASARPAGSRFPDLTGHYLVKIPAGADLEAAMAEFASERSLVDHVEPIGLHPVDLTPNDTYYANPPATFLHDQWHYWKRPYGIDADLAWDLATGSPAVAIGILDTGVKYRHSDLGGPNPPGPADNDTQGNVWVNPFEIPGNGIDDEGNGYVDDVIGWDFVSAAGGPGVTCLDNDCGGVENDPNDGEGHGTHVAGTVSAITNNARAVAGVAGGFSTGVTSGPGNGSKVMCLRIGYRARVQGIVTGVVNMAWAAQAMNYVADMKSRGVNVAAVNCSWGSSDTGGLSAAADNLLAQDVMILAAAGNSNSTTPRFLNTKAGVMNVGATDSTGNGASFSNHGSWVHLAAPGVAIMSTYHDPTDPDTTRMYVAYVEGTSMSTPHVCGVAALLESLRPSLSRSEKFNLMVGSTTPFHPANTKLLGSGILNARNALLQSVVSVAEGTPPAARRLALRAHPNPSPGGADLVARVDPGQRVRVSIVDAGGRLVYSLEQAADPAGVFRLRWDGRDVAGRPAGAGLYLVLAATQEARASAKLVVLR